MPRNATTATDLGSSSVAPVMGLAPIRVLQGNGTVPYCIRSYVQDAAASSAWYSRRGFVIKAMTFGRRLLEGGLEASESDEEGAEAGSITKGSA